MFTTNTVYLNTKFCASPRTVLTANRKPLMVKGEPVLQKSVEQLQRLRGRLELMIIK